MKTSLRIGVAGALLAVSAGVPWLLEHQAQVELRAGRGALEQQASQLSLLIEENGRLSNLVAQAQASSFLTAEQLRELLKLRNEKRWLAEEAESAAGMGAPASDPAGLSPAELEVVLAAEMTEALKRILPALRPALQAYSLAHSNQPPGNFSYLQDYFPLVGGRRMVGLQTFDFVRDEGPRPGDVLVLRGDAGRRPGDGSQVRVYGFADGPVVEVAAEDGRFDDWEAQHLTSAPAGTEDKFFLEAEGTAQERARVTEVGASVGISAEDASRFFDRVKQQHKVLNQELAEMEKSLAGSPDEKERQKRAAVEQQLNKLAIETLGDRGPALVQKLREPK